MESADSLKYFERPATPETGPTEEEKELEEAVAPIENDETQSAGLFDGACEEPTTLVGVEDPPERVPEHSSIMSIQVEEDALKASEQADLQLPEEPIVQEVLIEVPQAVQEIAFEQIPQAASPSIEDHKESVSVGVPQMLAEEPPDESGVPHPKTRWKSWKEKIQGFIKKLFG
jgi:hypothetical protein